MSEQSEKVLGIKHLPIFPLPLVLMPWEILPLHIFEEKYRQMLKDIELSKNMFGVSYFDAETSLDNKPLTNTVGCAAEIREIQTLEDGRSNVLSFGVIRYRLLDYIETGDEYLIADVEFFEDEPESAEVLDPIADDVFELFKRVAAAAHKLSGGRGTFPDIPKAEPEQLSFLVSAAFSLSPEIKQPMLDTRSTLERLENVKKFLSQAVDKIEDTANIIKISQTNGHAKKKVDY